MLRKINILFIVNALHYGGAEKHVISLLNSLDTDQFELSLACLKDDVSLLPDLNKKKLKKIIYCHVKEKIDLRAVKFLADYINTQKVDIIVCANQYPMLYGVLAKKNAGKTCPIIEVFHTTLIETSKGRLQMVFYRWFFNKCDCVVFVSKNQERYWIEQRKLKVKRAMTIHNGVDLSHYDFKLSNQKRKELLQELNFSPNDYIIGACAVLRPEKKHTDAIDAILKLRHKGIHAKLLLIGDGPEKIHIENHIKSVGLENDVIITGFKEDVRPYMSLCDCLVVTSHSIETFSIAALEAMAMGKPMIMSDVGGATEQIEHGNNGFIYTKGDVDALAGHISQLSEIAIRERFGGNALHAVKSKFSEERMISKYEDLFLNLMFNSIEPMQDIYGKMDNQCLVKCPPLIAKGEAPHQ